MLTPVDGEVIPGMVSILTNLLDRVDLTINCVGSALTNCGYSPMEFLCCDNASADPRMIEYLTSLNPFYLRKNPVNEGWAKGNNQMMYRARGEYFCLLDNDMGLNEGWLKYLVDSCLAIPETGVVSIYHGGPRGTSETRHGRRIWRENPLGVKLFPRKLVDKIGFFEEHCGLVYFADIYFNSRAEAAGFVNYYVDGVEGKNYDWPSGDPPWYRKLKEDNLNIPTPVARTGYVEGPGVR